jgi:LmbE family N-acetylglucosaminyl deacetylase
MLNIIPCYTSKDTPTILFLGAHSDDIEIGCGGSILKLSEENPEAHIHWVVFSAAGDRETEARQSATAMLAPFHSSQIETFDFKDGYFPHFNSAIKDQFEKLKAELVPDIIFTHHRDDLHQDHRIIGELCWNTFRDHFILEYEIPKYDGGLGNPNCFVNLPQPIVNKKCEHLNKHFATQRNQHWFSDDLFSGLMRLRGVECRSPSGFAEGFYSRKATLSWS